VVKVEKKSKIGCVLPKACQNRKIAKTTEISNMVICQVVGDGTYLFSVPSIVYWIASRYGIPVLTVVLNNRGK
jgi:thiamine pyrophosphate-dependent acetolactate synthase large subunit-like protein